MGLQWPPHAAPEFSIAKIKLLTYYVVDVDINLFFWMIYLFTVYVCYVTYRKLFFIIKTTCASFHMNFLSLVE